MTQGTRILNVGALVGYYYNMDTSKPPSPLLPRGGDYIRFTIYIYRPVYPTI